MKEIILVIPGLIGFFISSYILYSKKTSTPLICPAKQGCNEVVNSKYGKMFGFENTYIGIVFYLVIIMYGASEFFNRNLFKQDIIYHSLVGASILSVLFSIYLTFVQAFVLKKWCYYCLASALMSILILIILVV